MIKKEIGIGFLVGLIANAFGVLIYCLIIYSVQHTDIETTLRMARENGSLSKIIVSGATLNLAAFFGFLKVKRDYRARGVIIATIVIAIVSVIEHYIL